MREENKQDLPLGLGKRRENDSERQARPSFREAFRRAAEQTELHCCEEVCLDQMRELCYILAEVYIMDPGSKIKIENELMDAYLVQEIFSLLTFHHLDLVRKSFNAKTEPVRHKRAYLRTALYNSVFEYEAGLQNCLSSSLARGDR